MLAKLIIEGKEFDIEILDPKLQELVKPEAKKTGYECSTKEDVTYYFDNGGGYVGTSIDLCPGSCSSNAYVAANYYTSKQVAENNVRADKLMRQLRRFAVEHREYELNWYDDGQYKWSCYYDYQDGEIAVFADWDCRTFSNIYFDSEETANLAVETFYDELIWYFTEYKDSL